MTLVPVSHECRENFHVLQTSWELLVKILNLFKNLYAIFFTRLSRDCHATVTRRLCECREPVAAKFWLSYNAKFSRHLYKCRVSVV